ncbi:hypothetical protein [Roseibacillus persicicus]|uniref:hypothetical protein n=1 Tax=Roseibacillus persicicus TaxID=454148 RepID=UPI00280E2397|nr:hypothetical protein [Roseibacillus persicicus]MDQ8191877.1 hypothetical protein [Roseibacillus persicicus]
MDTSRFTYLLLLWALATSCAFAAEPLPAIPKSDRILNLEEVRNFWINFLKNKPIPKKPTNLHPERRAKWVKAFKQRDHQIQSIRDGHYDTAALKAQLTHNLAAYLAKKDEKGATVTRSQLNELNLHLEKLKTLRLQQEAARKAIATAEEVEALRAKVSSLESEISQLSSSCQH